MRAIEVKGSVDRNRQLHLDEPLPIAGPSPVRIVSSYSSRESTRAKRKRSKSWMG